MAVATLTCGEAMAVATLTCGLTLNLASCRGPAIALENVSTSCKPFLYSKISIAGSPLTILGRVNAAKRRQGIVARAASTSSSDALREFALKDFHARRALKIISGLKNFNKDSVASVVIAAEKGGATHVDIACDPELVKMAINLTCLPVCVSAVDPEAFLIAVEAGAHMVEIGNYDSFYDSGRIFSSEEILDLAKKTRQLLPFAVMSVTVPHTLGLADQVRLAELLEAEGADVIQTEGGTSSDPSRPGVHGLIEKAVPTLAAAYSISRAIRTPVMCASGISAVTAPMALAVGAAGVGVGSAVNKLNNQVGMIAEVRSIADALGLPSKTSKASLAAVGL